jgi:S-adenosylmethionine-diacylglycerol 3-amino-3-carboxypropyl transferase
MTHATALRRTTREGLRAAVHRNKALSKRGMLERLFTISFRGLVYSQIWEDPLIDIEALQIAPGDHIVAIASGGCNVLSYLIEDPGRITAVDLNGAHVALNRLKLCAARHFPDHATFFRFFGSAAAHENIAAYRHYLRPHLDPVSCKYWESRDFSGRRRLGMFTRNIFRYGLLGNFIGAAHWLAKLYGCDLKRLLEARSLEEQRLLFERIVAPMFDQRFVRWLVRHPASLYGLGIPPSQYKALAGADRNGMSGVLRARLERLACDFEFKDNYFAWQAFGRSYAGSGEAASLPPYLASRHFASIKACADRVDVRHGSFTEFLLTSPDASLDRYVLLDAQDWMTDADLTTLWAEITRTAKPGARVIFRTAAEPSLLPGRIPDAILARWAYDEDYCRGLTARDRSSIYGGFHLYELRAAS